MFFPHPGPSSSLGLLGQEPCAGCDHEHVVSGGPTTHETHPLSRCVDTVDRVPDVCDASMQLLIERSHQLVGIGQPEGDEKQTRLIDVRFTAVNHGDVD